MATRTVAPAAKAPRALRNKQRSTSSKVESDSNLQQYVTKLESDSTPRRRADWQAVERDYRTGKFTLRELEAKHGPSNSTIARRAAREKWSQDLSAAVRQATNAKLIAATVQQECSAAQQNAANTVLAAAEIGKQVIMAHRSELRDARTVATELLLELREQRLLDERRELLAEILAGEGATPVDMAAARKTVAQALSTSSRIGGIKSLADALTKLHAAERIAFDLDDDKGKEPDNPGGELSEQLATFVGQIHEAGAGRLPLASKVQR